MSSEYEKARAANIKRNEDFLKDIGLADLQQEIKATSVSEGLISSSSSRKRQRERRARAEGEGHTEGGQQQLQRRSRRLSQQASSSSGDSSRKEEEEEHAFLYLNDGHGASKVVNV